MKGTRKKWCTKLIFLACILIFLAGFCEGIMDLLQFHFHESVFSQRPKRLYWDPSVSWKNKYQNGDPAQGPRFFLSTTWLVSLTDAWHTFKLFRNVLIFTSLPIAGICAQSAIQLLLIAIVCRTLYGGGFWLSYYKILKKR